MDRDLPDPGSWRTWESLIEGGLRNDAWKSAGRWALECLNHHLGASWPRRAWTKYRIPTFLVWSPTHTVAFAQLLELALRLDLLAGCSGAGKLRRVLRQDPREEQIAHLALQLELGGLAMQAGLDVAFERSHGSARPVDVEIRSASKATKIETVALLQDERTRREQDSVDELFEAIRQLKWQCRVSFEIAFPRLLSLSEARAFLDALQSAQNSRSQVSVWQSKVLRCASLEIPTNKGRVFAGQSLGVTYGPG
jgi:hypothetical protein